MGWAQSKYYETIQYPDLDGDGKADVCGRFLDGIHCTLAKNGFGTATGYFNQRMWDFFAEHLLNDRQTGADINTREVKRK